jgi:hypothetical protein
MTNTVYEDQISLVRFMLRSKKASQCAELHVSSRSMKN